MRRTTRRDGSDRVTEKKYTNIYNEKKRKKKRGSESKRAREDSERGEVDAS